MKRFEERDAWKARDYSLAGGQALHCHRQLGSKPPSCFTRDVRAGKVIGRLFDQDRARLEAIARRLGVRVVVVERAGKPFQHVDLCGKPMERALAKAARHAMAEADAAISNDMLFGSSAAFGVTGHTVDLPEDR